MKRTLHGMCVAASLLLIAATAMASPSSDLERLQNDYWEGHLKANPVTATSIGDHRYDDRLDDNSAIGMKVNLQRLEGVLAQAQAIDASKLPVRSSSRP